MTNAARREVMAPVSQVSASALTPMDMLDKALQSNASVEVMEKFMALHERWEAGQQRKAFDAAVSAAKAKIKPIARNKSGHNDKRYVDFAAIASAVDPILAEHGLSYRFRTSQADGRINVTCVLSHRDGHSEDTTLSGPADTSGSKNAIQAIGSTLTYLQRYSLVQMLGLAAADDDDGKAGGAGQPISDEQILAIRDLIESTGSDQAKFLKFFKIEKLADLPAARHDEALKMLKAKAK